MHAIIVLNDGALRTGEGQPQGIAPTGVGDIVGTYKSLVVTEILKWIKTVTPETGLGKLWQRNYYEHIIRYEQSYQNISNYIINNPDNWQQGKFYHP